jgi:hypothetical protein
MKKALLIADSGGSKTDWCLVDHLGNAHYFTTESYHPHRMTEEWILEQAAFWKEYTAIYDLEVHFFGAGCLKENNQGVVKEAFAQWHITNVSVSSDLVGAAYALLGNQDGVIGILGTGSVAAVIRDHRVEQVLGGYGHLLGDEGSGYSFGKHLLYNYVHQAFSVDLMRELEKVLGTRETIFKEVYGPLGKNYISEISKRTVHLKEFEEIALLHQQNIAEFVEQYLVKHPGLTEISFVGSYAFHQQNNLRKVLEMMGVQLTKVIDRPIEHLTEYFVKHTF